MRLASAPTDDGLTINTKAALEMLMPSFRDDDEEASVPHRHRPGAPSP